MAKKKVVAEAPGLPSWWPTGFVPLVALDPASAMGAPFNWVFMLAPTFEGTLCVQRWANISSQLGIRDRVIPNRLIKNYRHLEEISLQSALLDLKAQMLAEGATPEAVRLVGEHIPITEEEYTKMAEKLTKKTAAKPAAAAKAPKAEKAPKTPKTPKAPAEAKSDDRKIKILKKDHGARAGTTRASLLDTIYASATVQEAVDAGIGKSDVSWAARSGYIELK